MKALTIADTAIRQDEAGRYLLNDLHRASGGHASHRPGEWLRNKQTQELVAEMGGAEFPAGPVARVNDGLNNGTYVAKELVYAYAMWISPAFHLKVIRAYDTLMTAPTADPLAMLNDPATMRGLLLGYTEKVLALEATVAAQAPKVAALDRIATGSDGSFCLTDAGKNLQVPPRRFFAKLQELGWIYRRPMGGDWLAYQTRIAQGVLEHKMTTGEKSDGSEWQSTQVRVTAKGMVKLAAIFVSGAEAA